MSKGKNRKMPNKKSKIHHESQKTRTNPQIKSNKNSHKLWLIRPQAQYKIPEHMYLKRQ